MSWYCKTGPAKPVQFVTSLNRDKMDFCFGRSPIMISRINHLDHNDISTTFQVDYDYRIRIEKKKKEKVLIPIHLAMNHSG